MGCKSSKDASQPAGPKTIGKGASSTPGKESPQKRHQSPSKGAATKIKDAPAAQLDQHKPQDILTFAKQGNLIMVNGLIKRYNVEYPSLVRGLKEEFALLKEKISTENWNPLHFAVAHKRIDVIKYLVNDIGMSVKQAGRAPINVNDVSYNSLVKAEIFCLFIAIQNKDVAAFEFLWSQHVAWDVPHLQQVLTALFEAKWAAGVKSCMSSYTSDMLFNSNSVARQFSLVQNLLQEVERFNDNNLLTALLDCLGQKPFVFITSLAIIDKDKSGVPSDTAAKFITGHIKNANSLDFGKIHIHPEFYALRQQEVTKFEEVSAACKTAVAKLREFQASMTEEVRANQVYGQSELGEGQLIRRIKDFMSQLNKEMLMQTLNDNDVRRFPVVPIAGTNTCPIPNSHNIAWPLSLFFLNSHGNEAVALKKDFLDFLRTSGFSLRQALRFYSDKSTEEDIFDNITINTNVFHALMNDIEVLKHLVSQEYIDLWTPNQFTILVNTVKEGRIGFLPELVKSPAFKAYFAALLPAERQDLLKKLISTTRKTSAETQMQPALAESPYREWYLIAMINRDTYKRTTDLEGFKKFVKDIPDYVLEDLGSVSENENTFMEFLRYNQLLDEHDPRREAAQVLIQRIFKMEKFSALANQSLHVLDNESRIQDEEHVSVKQTTLDVHAKKTLVMKDMDIYVLWRTIDNQDFAGFKKFMISYKFSDLLFLRGTEIETLEYKEPLEHIFDKRRIPKSQLSILQLLVLSGNLDMVKFLLEDYKIFIRGRDSRNVNQRIILTNLIKESDESLTLRIAIDKGNQEIFEYLWSNYAFLYNMEILSILVRYILHGQYNSKFLTFILGSSVTHRIFLNSSLNERSNFVSLFIPENFQHYTDVQDQILSNTIAREPYNQLDKQVSEDRIQSLVDYIKQNESGHMNEILELGLPGISEQETSVEHHEDTLVLTLEGDQKLMTSGLNPIILSVWFKSQNCLKILIDYFGLRQSMRGPMNSYTIIEKGEEFQFDNLMIPVLTKLQDVNILAYLLKINGFVFSSKDMLNFIKMSAAINWSEGINTLLWSNNAQFVFRQFNFDDQTTNFETLMEFVPHSMWVKVFTVRPYCVHFLIKIVTENNGKFTQSDLQNYLIEISKHLVSEDFMQLERKGHSDQLEDFAKSSSLESASLIFKRFNEEGRGAAYENKNKSVRFQNGE